MTASVGWAKRGGWRLFAVAAAIATFAVACEPNDGFWP